MYFSLKKENTQMAAYMEKVAYDKNLRQKIYDLIVEEALKDEMVLQLQ